MYVEKFIETFNDNFIDSIQWVRFRWTTLLGNAPQQNILDTWNCLAETQLETKKAQKNSLWRNGWWNWSREEFIRLENVENWITIEWQHMYIHRALKSWMKLNDYFKRAYMGRNI